MTTKHALSKWMLSGCMVCASLAALGAPPASSRRAGGASGLETQQKDVDAKLAAARAQQETLQSRVAQLEQQNAAKQKQLQQRDAGIAALQQKLRAAGAPASAASSAPAGH